MFGYLFLLPFLVQAISKNLQPGPLEESLQPLQLAPDHLLRQPLPTALTAAYTKSLWQSFITTYKKSYPSADFALRQGIFTDNLQRANQLQRQIAAGGEAAFGVTPWSDLTFGEFSKIYLMQGYNYVPKTPRDYPPPAALAEVAASSVLPKPVLGPIKLLPTLPTIDWSSVVTGVKNQNPCNTCWAFTAVETIESFANMGGLPLMELSTQQAAICSTKHPCADYGGPNEVYDYLKAQGTYLYSAAADPYNPNQMQDGCSLVGSAPPAKVHVVDYVSAGTNATYAHQWLDNDMKIGPVGIFMAADILFSYSGGIILDSSCFGGMNHFVQVVKREGGLDAGLFPATYTFRNSWGTGFGESGYFRFQFDQFGVAMCGIGTGIAYPILPDYLYGVDTCKQGYVWREAVTGDHICVDVSQRTQAWTDNAAQSGRVNPNGTCKPGYVWRLATNNYWMNNNPLDHVCVTQATATQVALDNYIYTADGRWVIPKILN